MWGSIAASRSATCFATLGLLFGLLPSASSFATPPGSRLSSTRQEHGRRSGRANTRGFMSPTDSGSGDEINGAGGVLDAEKGAYERLQGMLKNDGSTDFIFENNREWVEECLAKDPDTFNKLAKSQRPRYMYIGCSDSRVPAQNMMGLNTGQLFVVRNVANLCVNTDHSLLAALAYAVNVLEVTDIIVCGHYGCGGIQAAMENVDHGLLEHWLLNIRNVVRLHNEELQQIPDQDKRARRLVELNVQESCINLFANPIVQKKQALTSTPKIHGWAYDVENGLLQELKIDFRSEIRKYQDVYRLYEFPRRPNSNNNSSGNSNRQAPNREMTPRRQAPTTNTNGATTTARNNGAGEWAKDPKVVEGWAKHGNR
ncbi:unnamed protein product [Scytosiphon promiscuus]